MQLRAFLGRVEVSERDPRRLPPRESGSSRPARGRTRDATRGAERRTRTKPGSIPGGRTRRPHPPAPPADRRPERRTGPRHRPGARKRVAHRSPVCQETARASISSENQRSRASLGHRAGGLRAIGCPACVAARCPRGRRRTPRRPHPRPGRRGVLLALSPAQAETPCDRNDLHSPKWFPAGAPPQSWRFGAGARCDLGRSHAQKERPASSFRSRRTLIGGRPRRIRR